MTKIYTTFLALLAVFQLSAQVTITDADLGTGTYNWTNDNVYLLDGYVFLEAGGTLNIEAGTVIQGLGRPTAGNTSALIITQGATINAMGTQDAPIIFTSDLDEVDDPEDLDDTRKGLWGGLILLGNAPVGVDGGTSNIEGIPSTEGRAQYGGNDPADNSGTLRYVSIRHGGDKLEANNEINGLTLGGVGSGTTIDYIEVFANLDDGIEWFGGTVNVKHAVVSFCGDDSFDYDQSWDGKGQFWFSLQNNLSNRAGEWDGSERADLMPKAIPVISHATFIGAGDMTVNEDNNDALRIRDDAAVNLHNSILTDFARRAIAIDNDSEQDSYQRLLQGDLVFNRNLFFDFGAGNTFDAITSISEGGDKAPLLAQLVDNQNTIEDVMLGGISRVPDGNLDPRPDAGSPALENAFLIEDEFFDPVPYRGAFGNADNWAAGWTALSENGYFGDLRVVSSTNDPSQNEHGVSIVTYPNPIVETVATANIELPASTMVTVKIYDMSGRVLSIQSFNKMTAGKHNLDINISQLHTGIYIISLETDFGVVVQKVSVLERQ